MWLSCWNQCHILRCKSRRTRLPPAFRAQQKAIIVNTYTAADNSPTKILPRKQTHTDLFIRKCHCQICAKCHAQHGTVIRVNSAWNIDCKLFAGQDIQTLDQLSVYALDPAGESDTEDRIHQYIISVTAGYLFTAVSTTVFQTDLFQEILCRKDRNAVIVYDLQLFFIFRRRLCPIADHKDLNLMPL